MGMSLAFHIVFAVIGMAMPLLMAVSEGCYLWTKKPMFLELSKRWAAGTTILFAVGAVSGTVLSFELGLLWPKFMPICGRNHWDAVLARGLRLFHRGDLPGNL